jgi:hypothetical protein
MMLLHFCSMAVSLVLGTMAMKRAGRCMGPDIDRESGSDKGKSGRTDTGPEYAVKSLPGVNFTLSNSWAGMVPIGKGYGNDSLFFWLWGAETPSKSNDLIIWFNGGPGCSSLIGAFKENGPVLFKGNDTEPSKNPFSWTKLANVLYGTYWVRSDLGVEADRLSSGSATGCWVLQWGYACHG